MREPIRQPRLPHQEQYRPPSGLREAALLAVLSAFQSGCSIDEARLAGRAASGVESTEMESTADQDIQFCVATITGAIDQGINGYELAAINYPLEDSLRKNWGDEAVANYDAAIKPAVINLVVSDMHDVSRNSAAIELARGFDLPASDIIAVDPTIDQQTLKDAAKADLAESLTYAAAGPDNQYPQYFQTDVTTWEKLGFISDSDIANWPEAQKMLSLAEQGKSVESLPAAVGTLRSLLEAQNYDAAIALLTDWPDGSTNKEAAKPFVVEVIKKLLADTGDHSNNVENFFDKSNVKLIDLQLNSSETTALQALAKEGIMTYVKNPDGRMFSYVRDKWVKGGVFTTEEVNAWPEVKAAAKTAMLVYQHDGRMFSYVRDQWVEAGVFTKQEANQLPEIKGGAKDSIMNYVKNPDPQMFVYMRDQWIEAGVFTKTEVNAWPEVVQAFGEKIPQ